MIKLGENVRIFQPVVMLDEDKQFIIGNNCLIGQFAFVAPRKLVMHDGSQISPHAILCGGGEIELRKNSVVGFGSVLIPATDTTEAEYMNEAAPPDKRNIIRGKIVLGDGAYIGSHVVICVSRKNPEIYIGDHSVIGSFSYIDKSIEAYMIVHPKQELIFKTRMIK